MRVVEVAALVLLALGAERWLNLYLLGDGSGHHDLLRFTFSTTSLAVGVLLLVLAGYARLHTRR
jgi:hypothetical protein